MNVENVKKLVKLVINTNNTNLFIYGRGGIGKTHTVLSTLKEQGLEYGEDYAIIKGYITPLKFYQLLFEYNDKKLIIIDDTEGLFANKISKSLLKSCLEVVNGKKIVQYNSTHLKDSEFPFEFNFNPNVIVCANSVPIDVDFKAVLDRCFSYKLVVTNKELLVSIKEMIDKDYNNTTIDDRKVVFDILDLHIKEYHTNFSFRFYFKCLDAFLFDKFNWKDLVLESLVSNELFKLVINLDKSGMLVKDQYPLFYDNTGKSYRSFLRLRKHLGLHKYCKF